MDRLKISIALFISDYIAILKRAFIINTIVSFASLYMIVIFITDLISSWKVSLQDIYSVLVVPVIYLLLYSSYFISARFLLPSLANSWRNILVFNTVIVVFTWLMFSRTQNPEIFLYAIGSMFYSVIYKNVSEYYSKHGSWMMSITPFDWMVKDRTDLMMFSLKTLIISVNYIMVFITYDSRYNDVISWTREVCYTNYNNINIWYSFQIYIPQATSQN